MNNQLSDYSEFFFCQEEAAVVETDMHLKAIEDALYGLDKMARLSHALIARNSTWIGRLCQKMNQLKEIVRV